MRALFTEDDEDCLNINKVHLAIVLVSVAGPCSTTSPVISCPTTHGLANGSSPFITWRSEWQTPHAITKKHEQYQPP